MSEQAVAPLVVISPVRDEARLIRLTLDAMVAQTLRPQEWLLVDDGSSDDTLAIIQSYSARHPWIRACSRSARGERRVGAGVIAAFDDGRSQLQSTDYQYIAKLDGDMSFGPRYLEIMLARLASDPKLAAVSGKCFRPEGEGLVEEFIIDEMVAGQFKLYKRSCFEAIGGFPQCILWDGIDIHRCRMHGFTTLSFHDPEARLIHHRLMGSSDRSVYVGRRRLGAGMWFMGYHPLYMLASSVFRMREKPYVLGGLNTAYAYFLAMAKRAPRLDDPAFIEDLQRWQMQQLLRLPRKLWAKLSGRKPPTATESAG